MRKVISLNLPLEPPPRGHEPAERVVRTVYVEQLPKPARITFFETQKPPGKDDSAS
jgi:hypothetical protein